MEKEYLTPGHTACAGCMAALALRYTLKTLGKRTMMVNPACCSTIIAGSHGRSCIKLPWWHTAFETTAAVAVGIKAGLRAQGQEDINVVGWAGDGGTFDIGLQAISCAAEQNQDIIHICYDNEAYMNTGIQRSGATPLGAKTTTTPGGSILWKKNMPEIIAAHRASYVATISLAPPKFKDLIAKIEKAKNIKGFRYLQICVPCQAGWKFDAGLGLKIAKLALETGVYPSYEIENGKYEINYPRPDKQLKPIEEYLKLQGRFKHLKTEDIKEIQKKICKEWTLLLQKAGYEVPDMSYLIDRKIDI